MGLADMGYAPVSLVDPEHQLMLTDEVRSLLAVIAPWLAQQQAFLLVGGTGFAVRGHICSLLRLGKPGTCNTLHS